LLFGVAADTVKLGRTKFFLLIGAVLMVLSVVLALASIYAISTGEACSKTIIDDSFRLSPNEERRQGLGNFHGNTSLGNESLTLLVDASGDFVWNFSVITYGHSIYNYVGSGDVSYSFQSGADYYEAVFLVDGANSGDVHFQVIVDQPEFSYPYLWLSGPAKMLFLAASSVVMLALLFWVIYEKPNVCSDKLSVKMLGSAQRRVVLLLLAISLALWLALLAFNSSPLATFDNWYTDHARHTYTANLFVKNGLAVFSQPLDVLASGDKSAFMFVTWPEMPHLYPVGSLLLFLPFSLLVEAGVGAAAAFKLELTLFLVFAHVCLYYFFMRYFSQRNFPRLELKNTRENIGVLRMGSRREQALLIREYFDLALMAVGVYIIYMSLVVFAADGMFDSVPFLFGVLAVLSFLAGRYDVSLLLVGVSVLFKYQSAIFLFPFILVAVAMLLQQRGILGLLRNRFVVSAVALAALSGVTAYLSLPYLLDTRAELIMNGVNAFLPNAQINWPLQASAVLLTLTGTVVYAAYMLNKNKLMSLSAVFLLLPSFMLPYFQNWYLPYFFVYVLIPQRKNEFTATLIWLIFMVVVLSYGGSGFNPALLTSHFDSMLKTSFFGLAQ
jgi:hypothetical protein